MLVSPRNTEEAWLSGLEDLCREGREQEHVYVGWGQSIKRRGVWILVSFLGILGASYIIKG